MRLSRWVVAVVPLFALGFTPYAVEQAPSTLRSKVRQLDYLPQGWTQVLFTAQTSPALMTRNPNVQAVLVASISLQFDVLVSYKTGSLPPAIDNVSLSLHPVAGDAYVTEVACPSAGRCKVSISGRATPVLTSDARALGVVLAAAVKGRPLEDVTVNPQNVITRVKVSTQIQ